MTEKPTPPFRDRLWLEEHYCHKKLSAGKIGKLAGVSSSTIHYWLLRHQIPIRTHQRGRRPSLPYQDRDWLYRNLMDEGLTINQIARNLGVCRQTIEYWMKKYRIPLPPRALEELSVSEQARRAGLAGDEAWLVERLFAGRDVRQMAEEAGCEQKLVRLSLQRFGLQPRRPWKHPRYLRLCFERGLTLREIAQRNKAGLRFVSAKARQYGLIPLDLDAFPNWVYARLLRGAKPREISHDAYRTLSYLNNWAVGQGLSLERPWENEAFLQYALEAGHDALSLARALDAPLPSIEKALNGPEPLPEEEPQAVEETQPVPVEPPAPIPPQTHLDQTVKDVVRGGFWQGKPIQLSNRTYRCILRNAKEMTMRQFLAALSLTGEGGWQRHPLIQNWRNFGQLSLMEVRAVFLGE